MGGCTVLVFYRLTSPTPQAIPVETVAPGEKQQIEDRLNAFARPEAEESHARIELTAHDLNALIAKEPDLQGKAHLRIEGDQVLLDFSVPLERVGRYVNGSGAVKLRLQDGRFEGISIENATVNGTPLPEGLTKALSEGLMKGLNDPRRENPLKGKIRSLEVRDGKIILTR